MAAGKKKHVGLWVTLIAFTVIFVLPISLLYGLFFDSTVYGFVGSGIEATTLIEAKAVNGFASTKETGKVALSIEQQDINELLYTAQKSFPAETSNFLKDFYCQIDGNRYNFSFAAEVPLFKTRINISTSLAKYDDASGRGVAFKIEDIKLGRIGGMAGIATSLAGNYLNDQSLTDMFAGTGLNMKVTLAEGKITYARADYIADFKKFLGQTPLVSAFVDEVFNSEMVTLNTDTKIGLDIDLSTLHTHADYCSPERDLGIDLRAIDTKIATLLANNVIDRDANHLKQTLNFLVRGYDLASSEAKSYIQGKSFESIDIADITTYTGFDLGGGTSLTTAFASRITSSDVMLGKLGYIDEDDIAEAFKSNVAIGQGNILTAQNGTEFKAASICIDNFYANIMNGHVYLVVGFSMNGYETSVVLDTSIEMAEQKTMKLKVEKVNYGTHTASIEMKNAFYDVVADGLKGADTVTFDKTTGTFSFDFDAAFSQADPAAKALIDAAYSLGKGLKASIEGTALADNGKIVLELK